MKIGYIVGVFDQLHYGHKNIIIESFHLCDRLIIGVHTDEFTKSYKRLPSQNENHRKQCLENFILSIQPAIKDFQPNYIQLINDNHIDLIKKFNINTIYHGDDWDLESYKQQINYYQHNMDKLGVDIQLIPYSRGISTTMIINSNIRYKLQTKKCFLFDLDNTLLLNNQPKRFSYDIIDKLNKSNRDIYIITNNNRYSPNSIHKVLTQFQIKIPLVNIITTLTVIDTYLKKNNYKHIFVWGSNQAKQFFLKKGYHFDNPEIVIVLYHDEFNYLDITQLCQLTSKIPYIIGNPDRIYPDQNILRPDTGCLWKFLEYAIKKKPSLVCGKPNNLMLDTILKKYSISDIVFIGDSNETDKVLANKNNIDFIHVDETHGDISHLGVLCNYFN